MENQKVSAKNIMINYGAILGIISILISVSVYAMGKTYDQHWSIGVISFIVMVAILTMGIKKVKELNDGFLSLGEALKTGLGIALISGLISVAYTYVFTTIIEPDYFITLAEVQEQKWIDAGMTDEQIEMQLGIMEKTSGPVITSAFVIIGSLFFGFIISLIAGLIMKETKEE